MVTGAILTLAQSKDGPKRPLDARTEERMQSDRKCSENPAERRRQGGCADLCAMVMPRWGRCMCSWCVLSGPRGIFSPPKARHPLAPLVPLDFFTFFRRGLGGEEDGIVGELFGGDVREERVGVQVLSHPFMQV